MVERRRDLPLTDVLALQQRACEQAGSLLYARILAAMADDVRAGGRCLRILEPWSANAMADAVPLRFLAAVHTLVLTGAAPELARHYPSAGGSYPATDGGGDPVPAFLAVVEAYEHEIAGAMHLAVQTNEVGRSASLFGGFHEVARRSSLPLRQLEVGASAGLLLRWDHYGYRTSGGMAWGPQDGLVFDDPWTGRPPTLAPALAVAVRRGCDQAPIDPTTEAGATRLRSFLWPDQLDRLHRLDQAIEVARRVPVDVDAADAADWVEARLAEPSAGVATVVHHSIVLQYLPRQTFERFRHAIEDAGARATPEAPLHWLRMEPAGDVADVRLTSWSGAEPDEALLATSGYHGPPVSWLR